MTAHIETVFEKKNDGGKISLRLNRKEIGFISFVTVSENTINIDHTMVRREYEGQGYGKILVNSVIDIADRNNWKIIASCSYAERVMKKIKEQ